MKGLFYVFLVLALLPLDAFADKAIIVKDHVPSVETERQSVTAKVFCSTKSTDDAEKRCHTWLDDQRKTLGTRLLTSYCSGGEIGDINGCLYRSRGEVKYILRSTAP